MDAKENPHESGQQRNYTRNSTTPPAGCIDPNRITPAVAADPRWYGFRWNGKGTPPAYFYFPAADEVTFDSGEPAAIIPGPGKGSSFDVTRTALLDGAKLDGIAMLVPGTKRPELFNVRDGWIVWTKESIATQEEKIGLLDALGYYDDETRALLIEQGMLPEPPAGYGQDHHATERPQATEWPEPHPLPDELPAVEPFDDTLLPDVFRLWVKDIAERMQCPPDFPAVAAMVALAGVVGKQVAIRPKQRDDWLVVPNLWGAVIGRPGKLKTPAIEEPMKPLYLLEIAAKKNYDTAMEAFEADKWVSAEREKVKSADIRKALKEGTDANSIARQALNEAMPEPTRRRHVVNDPTVEKLGVLLNENPTGLLLFRDELTGWFRLLDKDGHENDRTFYLESWNGTGRYVYDRIGRGTIDIEHACVSILGGIQPQMLIEYMRTAPDDGLMQRFQLIVWPDDPGEWRNVDRYPDTEAKNKAYTVYQRLAAIDPLEVGAQQDGDIPFFRFAGDAQELFTEWRCDLESRLRNPDLPPAFETHLSKYRSLIPSLALLIHLADSNLGPVKLYALERAILWGDYLESHAKRIYAPTMVSGMGSARALARRLVAGDLGDVFALRDVYRNHWSYLANQEEALRAANVLVDFDWLIEEREPTAGRTKTLYRVNPRIREVAS